MLTLHRLGRGYRVLYTGVLLFMMAGTGVHTVHQAVRGGVSPHAIAAWYRGNAGEEHPDVILFEKPFEEVWHEVWLISTTYAIAFLVFAGVLSRSDVGRGILATLLVGFGGLGLVAAAVPLLVRYVSAAFAVAGTAAFVAMPALAVSMTAVALRDMWLRRDAGPRFARRGHGLVAGLAFGLALAAAPAAAGAQTRSDPHVLLTERQALAQVLPGAALLGARSFRPSASQRDALEESLGRRLYEPEYRFRVVYDSARTLLGYALVTEERGKYRPITFMVGITPDLRVSDVAVMVYRETRGGEVRRRRFLSQYEGKTSRDPIEIDRDIVKVSGATISVRALNAGVRKALAVAGVAFGDGPPAAGTTLVPLASLP